MNPLQSSWTSSCTCNGAKPKRERVGYTHLKVVESTVAVYMPHMGSKVIQQESNKKPNRDFAFAQSTL